jgi:hypothetical protein
VRRLMMLLLTSVVIATACAGPSSDRTSGNAEGTLLASLLRLQNSPSTVTLTLRSDPKSLHALAAQGGRDGLFGTDLNTVLSSSITVSSNHAPDPRDALSQTTVKIGDNSHAIETRMVDRTLYVRADARGLAKTFGHSERDLQRVAREAGSAGLSFMRPALEGKWLSVAGLDELARRSGAPLPAGADQQRATQALVKQLLNSATVSTLGEDAAGTHLRIIVPARAAYAGLRDMVQHLSAGLPGTPLPDPATLPDKNLKLDAWVRDGKLTQLEVDLKQLSAPGERLPAGVHLLALHMTIRDFTGTIEAPSEAVPVDLQKLSRSFMSGMAGGSASAMASSGTTL